MPGILNQDTCNKLCQEVLIYLARNPLTKFSRDALIGIFKPDDNRYIDQALKKLLAQELIAYQSNGNLYWLTPEEPAHSLLHAQFGGRLPASSMLFFEDRESALI
ncbi:MAG: hypothetical protein FWH51_03560 [Dehalococcoidia bacterium]|nr:hypothetical protein [Dehalococcoidia bacterium]